MNKPNKQIRNHVEGFRNEGLGSIGACSCRKFGVVQFANIIVQFYVGGGIAPF